MRVLALLGTCEGPLHDTTSSTVPREKEDPQLRDVMGGLAGSVFLT